MILENLDKYIKHKGLSYRKVENAVNASRGSISGALSNNRNIGANVVENILQKFPDLNADWLFTGRGNMLHYSDESVREPNGTYHLRTDKIEDLQQIPVYNAEATAGLVEIFNDLNEKTPVDYLRIPNITKCDGSIYITGDSMYPLLKAGDLVAYKIINNIEDNLFWGRMYVLGLDVEGDELITVKYIQPSEKGETFIKLVSKNEHHKPMDISKDRIRALAMVKATVRIE